MSDPLAVSLHPMYVETAYQQLKERKFPFVVVVAAAMGVHSFGFDAYDTFENGTTEFYKLDNGTQILVCAVGPAVKWEVITTDLIQFIPLDELMKRAKQAFGVENGDDTETETEPEYSPKGYL